MKLNEMNINETMMSDLKRKLQGKVSGKQQIKRVALSALQMMVDNIKEMDKHLDDPKQFQKFMVEQRKELIEAIKIIKAVED